MKKMITCSLTMLLLGYITGTSSASELQCGCRVTEVIKYYVHDNLLQKEGNNTAYVIAGSGGNITRQGDDGNLLLPEREIAVVGGTGQLRSASGYCFIRMVKQTNDWSYILECETPLSVPVVTDE